MIKKRDYEKFYESITAGVRKHPYGKKAVNIIDKVLTRVIFIVYPILLLWIFISSMKQDADIVKAFLHTVPFAAVPGISFVILSIIRHILSRKRPYEEYDIDPLIHKDKKGRSMPSRHVFSSAVISMCVLYVNIPLGVICLLITLGAAVIRVLGGVHYPGDVAVGLIAGVLSGCILFVL